MTGTQIDNIENYLWELIDSLGWSLVGKAKKCLSLLEDINFENSMSQLVTPHFCDTNNPPTIHFTFKKYHYELGISVEDSEKVYVCFNYLEGDTYWKEYINLDGLITSKRLKEVLRYFTQEDKFVIPPSY